MHCLRQVLHSGKRVATTICNLVSLSCILSYGPLDFIFHISLLSVLGVSQATSGAAFL